MRQAHERQGIVPRAADEERDRRGEHLDEDVASPAGHRHRHDRGPMLRDLIPGRLRHDGVQGRVAQRPGRVALPGHEQPRPDAGAAGGQGDQRREGRGAPVFDRVMQEGHHVRPG